MTNKQIDRQMTRLQELQKTLDVDISQIQSLIERNEDYYFLNKMHPILDELYSLVIQFSLRKDETLFDDVRRKDVIYQAKADLIKKILDL